ncbi:MAG TPA: NHL repeat-containing protein [Solirubrobacterales bacterium]|jgi:DNA-binding beta-propeller fold protein YncE
MCVVALLTAALAAPAAAGAFGPVSSFGADGEGAGQLSAPGAIAVGPEGDFFVVDQGNRRVDVFSGGGEFLYAFGRGVRPGGGEVCDQGSGCRAGEGGGVAGALERPEGIAVSSSGEVYVAEEGNDRVSVFSRGGVFMFAFGYRVAPGVEPPAGNVCDVASGCQSGSNVRVPPIEEETQNGPEGALAEPSGVAVDASGDVFVADTRNNRVSVFDPFGAFLYAFGTEVEGKPGFESFCETQCIEATAFFGAGGMNQPASIAIMPGGLLAVGDSENHRVDIFEAKPRGEFVRAIGREVDPTGGDVCTAATGCIAGTVEGVGALANPAGLAVSPTGAITVGDRESERVSQFNSEGEFVRAFGAGVVTGADAFEVCTALTGCLPGLQSAVAGATPHPFGVVEACGGSIFVSESTSGLSQVGRFGEPGSAAICPPPSKGIGPAPIPVRVVPTNLFQLGRLKRHRANGTATLLVTVPGSGALALGGRGIHQVARHPGAAATVALPIRLLGKARRGLLAAGRRRVAAAITFTPDGGSARNESRKLTLVKQLKPKPRRGR